MRKIIICIFLVLTFICSCLEKRETAVDWINKAQLLWDGEKYTNPKKAIEYLNNAIKLQQNNAETYQDLGNAYVNLGQYQRAIENYNKAIGLKQGYADAYNKRGVAYGYNGQYQQAADDFNNAIHLKQDYVEAYKNRGVTNIFHGNKKLGCSDLQKACELGDCKLLEEAKGKKLCR